MKLNDLAEGAVFCIGGTKSYPKLKLKKGYIDIRDRIHKPVCRDWDVEVIDLSELYKDFRIRFQMSKEDVDDWLGGLATAGESNGV